jgi:hypothetical protein
MGQSGRVVQGNFTWIRIDSFSLREKVGMRADALIR